MPNGQGETGIRKHLRADAGPEPDERQARDGDQGDVDRQRASAERGVHHDDQGADQQKSKKNEIQRVSAEFVASEKQQLSKPCLIEKWCFGGKRIEKDVLANDAAKLDGRASVNQ